MANTGAHYLARPREYPCEVCGRATSLRAGACTNGRCARCHDQHCTPGGETGPGHGRRWPDGLTRDAFVEQVRLTEEIIEELLVEERAEVGA